MMIAARLGPMMRARLNPLEFKAIASTISSRPTSSMISDWRVGMSNALDDAAEDRDADQHADRHVPRPVEPPEQRRLEQQQRLRDPHQHELVAPVGEHAGVQREEQHRERTRRRFHAHQKRAVRDLQHQPPSATCCIHVPISEPVCPNQKIRKFRCLMSTENGFR